MSTPWLEALPQGFDFYHLGRIELDEAAPDAEATALELATQEDRIAIAYSLEGETRGLLILLVEAGLDTSMYSEAGNIIASQLVRALSERYHLETLLSPPRTLTTEQFKGVLAGTQAGNAVMRTYTHRHGKNSVTLQAVLLTTAPTSSEAIGHA